MDQIKIGKFIQEKRKEKNITQQSLAEMLGITDRAISKWENGICMPDAGTIPLLCQILNITINDLFSGMVVDMKDYNEKADKNLLELTKQNEEMTKRLLFLEIVIGFMSSIIMMILIFVSAYIDMDNIIRVILISVGILIFLFGFVICMMIEQKVGYYECKHCHHKYIPTTNQIWWSMHVNRTRYMECPECHKKSWNKKVISK